MRIVWDEPKRLGNIAKHRLDFADLTLEFFLSAQVQPAKQERFLAIGDLDGTIVVAVVFPTTRIGSDLRHLNATRQSTRKGAGQMTKHWPTFETADLGNSDEDDAEMRRRWDVYDREMQALIAAGGVHQDADGWWVDDATGELIGPDPSIEKPATDEQLAQLRPLAEALPDLHASIQRARGRPVTGKARQVVSLRLDPEVVAKFKATGPGWQSRINDVLKKAKVG